MHLCGREEKKGATIGRVLVGSLDSAVKLTALSSMVPLALTVYSGILYSKQACESFSLLCLVSYWLWMVLYEFVRFRFQVSMNMRRAGRWDRLDSASGSKDERDAGVWRPDQVYSRGDVVTIPRSGLKHEEKLVLRSFCSIGGESPSELFGYTLNTSGVKESYKHKFYSVILRIENSLLDLFVGEVGPLAESRVVDLVLLSSALLSLYIGIGSFMSSEVSAQHQKLIL